MTDLVGERDVVGMGGPGHPGVLTRSRVHGMEVVGYIVGCKIAVISRGVKEDFGKAIGGTGHHETTLTGG